MGLLAIWSYVHTYMDLLAIHLARHRHIHGLARHLCIYIYIHTWTCSPTICTNSFQQEFRHSFCKKSSIREELKFAVVKQTPSV